VSRISEKVPHHFREEGATWIQMRLYRPAKLHTVRDSKV